MVPAGTTGVGAGVGTGTGGMALDGRPGSPTTPEGPASDLTRGAPTVVPGPPAPTTSATSTTMRAPPGWRATWTTASTADASWSRTASSGRAKPARSTIVSNRRRASSGPLA